MSSFFYTFACRITYFLTKEEYEEGGDGLSIGYIVAVSGPVIDVEFREGQLPKIREALEVTVEGKRCIMEVAQHLGLGTVRCIMMSGSDGLCSSLKPHSQ